MKNLDDWKKNNPPDRKIGKLKKVEDEIKQLHEDGYRVETINDYLKKVKKIEIGRTSIYTALNLKNFSLKNPHQLVGEKKVEVQQAEPEVRDIHAILDRLK